MRKTQNIESIERKRKGWYVKYKQIFNFQPSALKSHFYRFHRAVRVHTKGKRFRKFVVISGAENVPRNQRGMETYRNAMIDLFICE